MDFPEPLPERLEVIYQEILNGHFDEPEWADVTSTIEGHSATFHVFADALQIDGVRVNVSAEYEQKIADALDCMLLTAKLADLVWIQKTICLTPFPRTITSSVQGMLDHSADIDKALVKAGYAGGLICTVGKHWVIDNAIASNGKACNYGWHFNGQSYQGISGEACASLIKDPKTGMYYKLIQGRGTAHDMYHADYCLAPGTRVLTADLRWVPISSVEVGDELVGFDEHLSNPRLRRALVQSASDLEQECFEVVTSKGTVVASALHRWPVRGSRKHSYKGMKNGRTWSTTRRKMGWVETQALKAGDLIPYLCEPWAQDATWDGAWMAGFLDGEGWLSKTSFGFGQNPGPLLDRALDILHRNGMETYQCPNKKGCVKVQVLGPRGSLRALGTFRPLRLMAKSPSAWEGTRAYGGGKLKVEETSAEVLEVRPLGPQRVIGVGTSTGTLIAEGLLSHNSQTCVLVHAWCEVDGSPMRLADVLTNPELAPLASCQGVMTVLRQPGVPEPENHQLVLPEVRIIGRIPTS